MSGSTFLRSGSSTLRLDFTDDDVTVAEASPDPAAIASCLRVRVTRRSGPACVVAANDRQHEAWVAVDGQTRWVFVEGELFRFEADTHGHRRSKSAHGVQDHLAAPMPATVGKVLVVAGQRVRRGETLVLLEAMKMELPLRAPHDAVVTRIDCVEGELVQPGRTLVDLEEA